MTLGTLTDTEIHDIMGAAHGKLNDAFCRHTLFYMMGYIGMSEDSRARQELFTIVKHQLEKQAQ